MSYVGNERTERESRTDKLISREVRLHESPTDRGRLQGLVGRSRRTQQYLIAKSIEELFAKRSSNVMIFNLPNRRIVRNGVYCDEDGYDHFFPFELEKMKKKTE